MNIVSLNVNQFLGHHSWSEFTENAAGYEKESDNYQPKVMQYLKGHIKGIDDIAILHEIPYSISE